MDAQLGEEINRQPRPMPFALAECLLDKLRDSGATEEEAIAALKTAEAMLPLLELQSRKRVTIRT